MRFFIFKSNKIIAKYAKNTTRLPPLNGFCIFVYLSKFLRSKLYQPQIYNKVFSHPLHIPPRIIGQLSVGKAATRTFGKPAHL
jgi:hypothetical protein